MSVWVKLNHDINVAVGAEVVTQDGTEERKFGDVTPIAELFDRGHGKVDRGFDHGEIPQGLE